MNITTKITASFILGIAAMGVAVHTATNGLVQSAQSVNQLTTVKGPLLDAFNDMYSYGLQAELAMRNIVIDPNDNQARHTLEQYNQRFVDAMNKASDLAPSGDTALIDKIQQSWARDTTAKDQVVHLAQTGQAAQAEVYIKSTELDQWHDVRSTLLAKIKNLKGDKAASIAEIGQVMASSASQSMIIAIGGASIGIVLMIVSIISLFARMRLAARVLGEIGDRGDLTVDIPITEKDEVSTILRQVDQLRTRLSVITYGVEENAKNLSKGTLTPDEQQFTGTKLRGLTGMFKI